MSQRFGLSTARAELLLAFEGRALSSSSGISASEVATTAEPPFPRKPVDAWGSRPSHFPFEVRHGGPSAPPAIPRAYQNLRSGVLPPAALVGVSQPSRISTQTDSWLVIVQSEQNRTEQAPHAPQGDVQCVLASGFLIPMSTKVATCP